MRMSFCLFVEELTIKIKKFQKNLFRFNLVDEKFNRSDTFS